MINFFYGLVKETVDYRQKNSYRRNDFLQTMIELKTADENGNSRLYFYNLLIEKSK